MAGVLIKEDTWKIFTVSILPDELKGEFIEQLIGEADKAGDKQVPYLRLKL